MNKQTTKKTTQVTKVARPRKPKLKDYFIREVEVRYEHTSEALFKIASSTDIANFLRSVCRDNTREHFFALYLNGAHQVAAYSLIAIGGANSCQIHPREVFQRAILSGAVSLVIAHNHPPLNLKASEPDWRTTFSFLEAGKLLGIELLDHVIFSDQSEISLREEQRWYQGR